MFTKEFIELLKEILKSWQVIVVAVVFIFYVKIVSYVGRGYHVPRRKKVKIMRKEKASPASAAGSEESGGGGNSNDELGLEEA
jgi:hypothetical protein